MDFEEKVRGEVVGVLGGLARGKPNTVPPEILRQLAERLRDKKVRKERTVIFGLLYRKTLEGLLRGKEGFLGFIKVVVFSGF